MIRAKRIVTSWSVAGLSFIYLATSSSIHPYRSIAELSLIDTMRLQEEISALNSLKPNQAASLMGLIRRPFFLWDLSEGFL